MLKALARAVVDCLPGATPLLVKDWINRLRLPDYRRWRSFEDRVIAQLGSPTTILYGPFHGMPYVSHAFHSPRIPKLLGTYEMELHSVLETIGTSDLDLLVDIGAAEGYYAVGLARLVPSANIVAFEAERPARALLRDLLALNGLSRRVRVEGLCTTAALDKVLRSGQRSLVFCDCEGAEDSLLDPEQVPGLGSATILVETHDRKVPGVTERLVARFERTHRIERIPTRERTAQDVPPGVPLSVEDALEAMVERSHPQEFLFMQPLVEGPRPRLRRAAVGATAPCK